jgi:hypothetical protein
MGCGIDKRTVERSTVDVLLGDADAASVLRSVDYADFKVMPANQDLVAADVEMMGKAGCESRLRDALQPLLPLFDIVLIDCPPALNMLTVNALVAAEGVLEGAIGTGQVGDNGFGYDPVFVLPDGRTLAQLPSEEKNRDSHRARAIRALAAAL